jgi:hypothetical protein
MNVFPQSRAYDKQELFTVELFIRFYVPLIFFTWRFRDFLYLI